MPTSSEAALKCNFGQAKPGDELLLSSPFAAFEEPVEARLTAVKGPEGLRTHQYALYLFGIWFGAVEAQEVSPGFVPVWKVIT